MEKKNLRVIKTVKDDLIEDSLLLLREAMDEKFETVLIIGVKDDKVLFRSSRSVDSTYKLGMIELAKFEFLKEWK